MRLNADAVQCCHIANGFAVLPVRNCIDMTPAPLKLRDYVPGILLRRGSSITQLHMLVSNACAPLRRVCNAFPVFNAHYKHI